MSKRSRTFVLGLALLPAMLGAGAGAGAADRHAGYYYPEPQSREEYQARSKPLAEAGRGQRLEFINALAMQLISAPYPPQVAIFAKGEGAEKLIIVALYENGYNTLYRLRALLAMLTAASRQTPFFKKHDGADAYTFLDLLKLFGFEQLTVSDGDRLAHQITID